MKLTWKPFKNNIDGYDAEGNRLYSICQTPDRYILDVITVTDTPEGYWDYVQVDRFKSLSEAKRFAEKHYKKEAPYNGT